MIRIFVISVMILMMTIVIPINVRAQNITATGENESIIAHTDKKSYVVGEHVVLSGKVSPVVKGERLRIDVYDPKGAVFKDNIGVAYLNNDGTFSTYSDNEFLAYSYLNLDKNSVKNYGMYKVMISYNGVSKVISFNVTPTA
jgi:hypothetical protein